MMACIFSFYDFWDLWLLETKFLVTNQPPATRANSNTNKNLDNYLCIGHYNSKVKFFDKEILECSRTNIFIWNFLEGAFDFRYIEEWFWVFVLTLVPLISYHMTNKC